MKNTMKHHLLIVDPQNDFCDIKNPETGEDAKLPVPGADKDMKRLANFITRMSPKLEGIHVTLDSHQVLDIAHASWWEDSLGNSPPPYTIISASDIRAAVWTPRLVKYRALVLEYAEKLEASGKYQITIWPTHCLIGSWGHNVHSVVHQALQKWSATNLRAIDYIFKGLNPLTEHYGALMAEVPNPNDVTTELNVGLLNKLNKGDVIFVAGEALSHCVKETVIQIVNNIGEDNIKKIHILTDCTSAIPKIPGGIDFPAIGQKFLNDMEKRGVTLSNSEKVML
jgi:nicotinamidase/pyrazinamidase